MFVLLGALGAGVALVALAGASQLWTRPYWTDELCCTVYPVQDSPSLLDVFGNVGRDDVAPPLLHVIVWIVGKVAGSFSPAVLRGVATGSVVLALVLVYAALRRRFGRMASVAAIGAIAANSLVIYHAINARFYGPWLTLAAAYAWSLGIDSTSIRSRQRDVAQAAFAACVCLIHWYGVISLVLMALAAIAAHGKRWREGLRLVTPSLAGVAVLAAFLPMLNAQTRQSREILDWVPPLSMSQVSEHASFFWISAPVLVAAALLIADRVRPAGARASGASLRDPSSAALLGLALMPVVLIVLSILVTPMMVPRYAIPAALAVAPLVALAVEATGPIAGVVMVAVSAIFLTRAGGTELRRIQWFDATMRAYRSEMQAAAKDRVPMVFPSYFTIYPVAGPDRRRSSALFLYLPDSAIGRLYPSPEREPDRRSLRMERSFALLHRRVFDFPDGITLEALERVPRFYLFSIDESLPRRNVERFGQVLFPHHEVRRLNPYVTLFQRVAAVGRAGTR